MDVRVYTTEDKAKKCHFALEVASRALDWYSEFCGVSMPLPKCDLIAIPDFSWGLILYFVHLNNSKKYIEGAMENWGLITFRERSIIILLY